MRKLLVVAPLVLLLALLACGCGGGSEDSNTLKVEVTPSGENQLPPYNVEGEWARRKGPTHERFVGFNAHSEHVYLGTSRFVTSQKGIRLKLDSKSTLIEAEACYDGIDLFCNRWSGESFLPFTKTLTIENKKYHVHLLWAFVGICDPAEAEPSVSKQTPHSPNQA